MVRKKMRVREREGGVRKREGERKVFETKT
jgi:hypothetical protein